MNEQVVETGPLAGLQHGLHLPMSVSIWPPAPLWWLLALLLTLLMCWLTMFLLRKKGLRPFGHATKRTTESIAQTTQRLLQQCYMQWQKDAVGTVYLEQANILLKRYVLSNNSESHLNNASVKNLAAGGETGENNLNNTMRLPAIWHGEAWVEWMQQAAPTRLSQITRQGLADDCYKREATLVSVPIAEIHTQLLQWVSDYEDRQNA